MVFLGFGCVCKKVNMFLYFWNKNAENKSVCKCVGKVFLMVKIGPGFMGSLAYSLVKLRWH
jgi:hypothetical protein